MSRPATPTADPGHSQVGPDFPPVRADFPPVPRAPQEGPSASLNDSAVGMLGFGAAQADTGTPPANPSALHSDSATPPSGPIAGDHPEVAPALDTPSASVTNAAPGGRHPRHLPPLRQSREALANTAFRGALGTPTTMEEFGMALLRMQASLPVHFQRLTVVMVMMILHPEDPNLPLIVHSMDASFPSCEYALQVLQTVRPYLSPRALLQGATPWGRRSTGRQLRRAEAELGHSVGFPGELLSQLRREKAAVGARLREEQAGREAVTRQLQECRAKVVLCHSLPHVARKSG